MATAMLRKRYMGLGHIILSYSNTATKSNHPRLCRCHYYNRWSDNLFRKQGKAIDLAEPSSGLSYSRNGFVNWYLEMIKTRPVLTKSITCCLIYIAADFTSQTISLPKYQPYDSLRTLRMAGYGLVILGPSLHYWFNFVSRILPRRDLLTTVKKMALGQALYGPFMTVVFFSLNAALQGEQPREIIARLNRDLLPTMLNGVMYWPICDFITFKFVPVHLQPLVSNSFSYVWTVYITYMASLEKATTS